MTTLFRPDPITEAQIEADYRERDEERASGLIEASNHLDTATSELDFAIGALIHDNNIITALYSIQRSRAHIRFAATVFGREVAARMTCPTCHGSRYETGGTSDEALPCSTCEGAGTLLCAADRNQEHPSTIQPQLARDLYDRLPPPFTAGSFPESSLLRRALANYLDRADPQPVRSFDAVLW